jgi:hypothetical protein
MMNTDEILEALNKKGIRNIEIANALGLPDSRVPEIKSKRRALKLDEAVKLVQAFGLEQGRLLVPLPTSVYRLVVRYLADELGASLPESQIADLTKDVQAFAAFAADPKVRQSLDAAEGFFRALRLRRRESEPSSPQGTDPHPAR